MADEKPIEKNGSPAGAPQHVSGSATAHRQPIDARVPRNRSVEQMPVVTVAVLAGGKPPVLVGADGGAVTNGMLRPVTSHAAAHGLAQPVREVSSDGAVLYGARGPRSPMPPAGIVGSSAMGRPAAGSYPRRAEGLVQNLVQPGTGVAGGGAILENGPAPQSGQVILATDSGSAAYARPSEGRTSALPDLAVQGSPQTVGAGRLNRAAKSSARGACPCSSTGCPCRSSGQACACEGGGATATCPCARSSGAPQQPADARTTFALMNAAPNGQPGCGKDCGAGAIAASPSDCQPCSFSRSTRSEPTDPGDQRDGPDSEDRQSAVSRCGRRTARREGYDTDAEAEWKDLSRAVYAARQMGIAQRMTPALLKAARADPSTPFAPLYGLWAHDNCQRVGLHEEALEIASEWEQRWPNAELLGGSLLPSVLRGAADAARRLGEPQLAEQILMRLITSEKRTSDGGGPGEAWYALGELAQEEGDETKAIWAFENAARSPSRPPVATVAERNARRLRARTDWVRPDPALLARQLLRAMRKRDEAALWALASKTHFSLGQVGGERAFTEPEVVLPSLLRDLRSSKIDGHPERLEGTGGKRYLATHGWRGDVFAGRTWFLISAAPGGWEWSGIGTELRLPETNRLYEKVCGPSIALSNNPLEVPIKAPWPAGVGMQAGGLTEFANLTAGDPIAQLFHMFLRIAIGDRPCGFGPGGFYYNPLNEQNLTSHKYSYSGPNDYSDDQYAIDFSRWERANAFPSNLSQNVPVLACADGVVIRTVGHFATSQEGGGNGVDHRLMGWWGEDTPYTASYWHLDGPDRLLVTPGMWVDQGTVLGYIDDTGTSFYHHLHFEMHDSRIRHATPVYGTPYLDVLGSPYGHTVRPTPMDEQPLNDENDGRCIMSSNVPVPALAYCGALAGLGVVDHIVCLRAGLDPTPWIRLEDRRGHTSVLTNPREHCEWRAERAPEEIREEMRRFCRAMPDREREPTHDRRRDPAEPPDMAREPKAFCYWWADHAPGLTGYERNEIRRTCRSMPDDPV